MHGVESLPQTSWRRAKPMEPLIILGAFALLVVLQIWVLPRLGVRT
jgi:hypothetical protein